MEIPMANGRFPPGVRFHPTDVELVVHYLKRKLLGKRLEPKLVAEVDIYQFHPADLRERACLNKDLNWYFFCARGKKYCSGGRTNRATQTGYWKATGNGRAVLYQERTVGKVQTLVFHEGKPPKGERTDWVMYEYRLEDVELANKGVSNAFVLCKIFKKSGWGPRNGEQYGAPYNEEEWNMEDITNNAEMAVSVAAQDQSASAVTGSSVINVSVSVQDQSAPGVTDSAVINASVSCGDISVSGVDQAPSPTSDGANVASNPKAVDNKTPDAMPNAAAADLAWSSYDPVPNSVDEMFSVDDFEGIYDNLEDISI